MNTCFKWFSYLVLILAAVLIFYIGFNLLYPYPTIVVQQPIPVLNNPVHQGEILQVQIVCEKFTDRPATITRQFVNEFVYVMPSYKSSYTLGKHDSVSLSTRIPVELPAGTYYIHTTLEYEFPPFRTVIYTFDTEKFEVIKQ